MDARYVLTIAAVSLGFIGTASSLQAGGSGSEPAAPAQARQAAAVKRIAVGMSKDEVLHVLGKPESTRTMPAREGETPGEIWEYRRTLGITVRQVITGTERSSVGHNNVTGEIAYAETPIYKNESTRQEEVTYLLFYEGKLITSKRVVESQRSME